MIQVKIPEPEAGYLRAAAAHLTARGVKTSVKALVLRGIERELSEVAKADQAGRILRANGWRRKGGAP